MNSYSERKAANNDGMCPDWRPEPSKPESPIMKADYSGRAVEKIINDMKRDLKLTDAQWCSIKFHLYNNLLVFTMKSVLDIRDVDMINKGRSLDIREDQERKCHFSIADRIMDGKFSGKVVTSNGLQEQTEIGLVVVRIP